MGSEWKETTIGNVAQVIGGGTPSSKAPEYWGEDIPWITPKDLSSNYFRYIERGERSISKLGLQKSSARKLPKNTVLVTSRAPIGYVAIAKNEVTTNQGFKSLILNDDQSHDFFYYLIKHIVPELEAHSSGSTFKEISGSLMKKIQIKVPPLPEQKAIAHILGTLDDKIELNRRMNATLEGMAQALFKSWFVDFDPVIDNALAAGNPIPDELAPRARLRAAHRQAEVRKKALGERSSSCVSSKKDGAGAPSPPGTTQQGSLDHPTLSDSKSLFPAAFQFTEELGWIPEGWEQHELGDFVNIKHGYAFKGEFFSSEETSDVLMTPGNFRIGGGFKNDKLKFYTGPIAEDYILHTNDLIVTMTDLSKAGDTLGYPAFVPPSAQLTYHHNQRIGLVNIEDEKIGKHYIYQILRSPAYRDEILGSMSGSTVKHTSPSKIEAFTFPFAGGKLEQRFENEARALEEKITANNSTSETLTKLRDTLLPKLIGGELTTSNS